jgi:hypothetical protein
MLLPLACHDLAYSTRQVQPTLASLLFELRPSVPQIHRAILCPHFAYLLGTFSVERGLLHPNTLTIELPAVFIGLRPTGLPSNIKEFVMNVVSAQLGDGVHDIEKVEIAKAISRAGGSVSRSGLKLALAELSEGTTRLPPRLFRVTPCRYAMRNAESQSNR